MTQDNKILATSKKVPAQSLDKIKLTMTEFFFTLTKNKTTIFRNKILENESHFSNKQHRS